MASSRKHIDAFLREKWQQLRFSSNESEWEDFERFCKKKKQKRNFRGFLFFFTGMAALAAVLLYYTSPRSSPSAGEPFRIAEEREADSIFTDKKTSSPFQESIIHTEKVTSKAESSRKEQHRSVFSSPGPDKEKPFNTGRLDRTERKEDIYFMENRENDSVMPWKSAGEEKIHLLSLVLPGIQARARTDSFAAWQETSLRKLEVFSGKKGFFTQSPALFFAFRPGFVRSKSGVGSSDPAKTHQSYMHQLSAAVKPAFSFELDVGYRLRPWKNMQVSAGVEISSVSQVYHYHFENREVPVFDQNDQIIDYIQLPASVPPAFTINFRENQQVSSFLIPLELSYFLHIGKRSSLGMSGLVSAGYSLSTGDLGGINPSDLTAIAYSNVVRPFRLSYGGSFFWEYQWSRSWGSQLGFRIMSQNSLYREHVPFTIKNTVYGVNFLLIRYL